MQPENVVMLNIDLLVPNSNQPRKYFNDQSLKELAISIKEYGILNPILARKKEDKYEIIAGERRYRAAKMVGLTEVPVIIKNIEESKISELALIENLQRENISQIEEAKTYDEILKNNNITEAKLSVMIGKSQPYIANKIRLLKLPKSIQEAVTNKQISERHARSLLTINDEKKQEELLEKIIKEKLSVKELDNLIKNKEEEKESDNMNNGNFFPNYNSNEQNNNMSLNTMNMQTMNMPNPEPQVDQNMNMAPTMPQSPMPSPLPQVEIENMEPTAPAAEPFSMPNINSEVNSPIPEFGVNAPLNENNSPIETAPPSLDNIPPVSPMQPVEPILPSEPTPATEPVSANVNPVVPSLEEQTPVIQPTAPQVPETPLFNQELSNPAPAVEPNLNESFYDVPVNVSPVIETPQEDKLMKIEQLLSSNNIEYKKYSNETGHCIIIEL